jgi:hypothetical protein
MKAIWFIILMFAPFGLFLKDAPNGGVTVSKSVESVQAQQTDSGSTPDTSTTAVVHKPAVAVTTTTTTSPPLEIPRSALCGRWWSTAVSMGWPEELLPTLDRVMWNESRCQSSALNGSIEHGDIGLTQISMIYHSDRAAALGYTHAELFYPAVNLMIAYQIYLDALATSPNCGWWPWAPSGNYCK